MSNVRYFFIGFGKGFKGFSLKVTDIFNFILAFIVYFTSVGITSVIAKLFGKHFLELKPNKKSYWIKHKPIKKPIEDYYRQF